jgi:hydrogenase-4 component E
MTTLLNTLLVIVVVLNFFILGTGRIASVIRSVALQGALLGLLPLLMHSHLTPPVVLSVLMTVAIKGLLIPFMMFRAMGRIQIRHEVEPFIGLQTSVILGAIGTGVALLFSNRLPLAAEHAHLLIVPASLSTMLTGFLLLITRYKALSQVMGYLVLENGIFCFGVLLVEGLPLVVEMGVLLDLLAAIFVILIIVNRISQAFASLDTRHLATLKE